MFYLQWQENANNLKVQSTTETIMWQFTTEFTTECCTAFWNNVCKALQYHMNMLMGGEKGQKIKFIVQKVFKS